MSNVMQAIIVMRIKEMQDQIKELTEERNLLKMDVDLLNKKLVDVMKDVDYYNIKNFDMLLKNDWTLDFPTTEFQ